MYTYVLTERFAFLKSPFRVSSFFQLSLFPSFPPSNVLGVQLLMPTTGSLLATEDYKNEAQVLVAVVIMMRKTVVMMIN